MYDSLLDELAEMEKTSPESDGSCAKAHIHCLKRIGPSLIIDFLQDFGEGVAASAIGLMGHGLGLRLTVRK